MAAGGRREPAAAVDRRSVEAYDRRVPSVQVERSIDVPAAVVYRLIADFENHHPRFLPPAFSELELESGGVGAGTVHRVTIRAAGRSQTYRMRVDEPEPGRVLTETQLDGPAVTTYTVDPEGQGSRVRLETEWAAAAGPSGIADRLLGPLFARRLYADLLERLDRYARDQAG